MVFERVFLVRSKLVAIVIASIFVAACGGNSSTPPNAEFAAAVPIAGAATSPASTNVGTATLSWLPPGANNDGSILSDLSGYRILYGRDATNLDRSISITNPTLSAYVIEDLGAGTWYFGVVAVNSLGIESGLSGVVSKTIG